MDDEPAMAYFLPNGIADDSPPKKSRMKASFGPIGGRSAAVSSPSTTTAANTAVASNSRGDVDFSGLHTRSRPTLDPSPFRPSGGSSSPPRATNFLLSDLGGEIHTPHSLGESKGSTPTASRPFGFPGAFGSGLSDGGAIGAGAIRSPTSMFDRGQEAKSFSMESRPSLNSGAYGVEPQLYPAASNLSYLGGEEDRTFGSSMRTWPSDATPRRILQRPPGLAGPPGLIDPNPMEGMQSRIRLGSGGDMMQQRVSAPHFGPFHPATSSPIAAGSSGAFSSEDQYRPSLLSSLRLSSGVFGDSSLNEQTDTRGVSNAGLAELNTQSMKIGNVDGMARQAVDSSVQWDREPTSSRRIDIQASSKTPRSPKKARDGRRKPEGRSDLRAKALEFSMDAINAFTPNSPARPRRADRGRHIFSPGSAHEPSPSSYESSRNCSEPAPRGKRRNQAVDKASGNDNRRRGMTNQNEESGTSLTPPPGLDHGDSPVKLTSREPSKSRRREDTKLSTRTTSRRNSARGNEKGPSTTRRQVYREKQMKDPVKESGETTPSVASPSTASNSPQGSQVSSDSQQPEVRSHGPKRDTTSTTENKASSLSKAGNAPEVATTPSKSKTECVTEVADASTSRGDKRNTDENIAGPTSPVIDEAAVTTNISLEEAHEEQFASTERESSSSSDIPEDVQGPIIELSKSTHESKADLPDPEGILLDSSESDAERGRALSSSQPTVSRKKSNRKSAVPAHADTDVKPPATHSEAQLPVPVEPLQAPVIEKKHATKDHRKEKSKKDKGDKKKSTRSKKEKRGSSLLSKATDALNQSTTDAQDKLLESLASNSTPLSARVSQGLRKGTMAAASAGLTAFVGTRRGCIWVASRLNIKGVLATTFSYVESVLAVVFSVVLLLSLHAASWFIRVHRVAFRAILTHRHIGFCFAFLYGFPFLVQYVFPWAPPWAPVCLWYAFLVQLFCTNGPTAMVTTFRVILPLVFLVEGISHHSFLLDLNGAELLLTSFIISALKTSNLCSPIFFLSLATQCLLAVFLGSELVVQWLQLALALYSLHIMAATDDEWFGIGDEEEQQSCNPVSMHHSIADYNHHPAPSSAVSIQKTKRLDRRALAYVRGRKLR